MNNLTLGSDAFTYYETLGGGQGACADAPTARAACTSRCRTRCNTPVEALELEFPLRVREYAIRRGSGGAGRAAAAATASCASSRRSSRWPSRLLTERRRHAPPGAAGGEPGARGRNLLDGEELPPKARGSLAARSDACGSRRQEVADMAGEPLGFIGLGIMGSRMAANLARAGYEVRVWNRTRGEGARRGSAEHGGTRGRLAARGRRGRRGGDHDGRRRPAGRAGAARRGRRGARRRARARCSSTCRRSRRRDARRIGAALAEREPALRRRAGHRLLAEGGGRHADDHGRRREADFARARPYFEAMGEVILHVGELGHGQKVKVISNAVAATNCATLAQALVVGKASGRRPGGARARCFGASAANSTMVGAQGGADARSTTTRRCSGSSTCSRTSAICLDESAGRRRAVPGRRARPRALRRGAWAAGSATRTSRRCSRRSRASPASGSDAASAKRRLYVSRHPLICRDIMGSRRVCA